MTALSGAPLYRARCRQQEDGGHARDEHTDTDRTNRNHAGPGSCRPRAGYSGGFGHSTPRCRPATRVADPIVSGRFDAKTGNYLYETGQPTTLRLPGGGTITGGGANSTEGNLFRFLSDSQVQVDTVDLTRGWHNFDRVFFEAGKATLTPASVSQLRNIATLLRAFPKACIKLGGYTDDTDTYKVNRELSDAHARTAWASLVEMGISPSRLDARGSAPTTPSPPTTPRKATPRTAA